MVQSKVKRPSILVHCVWPNEVCRRPCMHFQLGHCVNGHSAVIPEKWFFEEGNQQPKSLTPNAPSMFQYILRMLLRGHSGKEKHTVFVSSYLQICWNIARHRGLAMTVLFSCARIYLNAFGKLGISRNGLQLLPCSPSREKRQIGQEAEDAATGPERSGVSQLCNPGEEPTRMSGEFLLPWSWTCRIQSVLGRILCTRCCV